VAAEAAALTAAAAGDLMEAVALTVAVLTDTNKLEV
jgi:hypothetical protein